MLAFDFAGHRRNAESQYAPKYELYKEFSAEVRDILAKALEARDVKVSSIEARGKTPESFGRKAARPSELDNNRPRYERPLEQIDDMAGVRVITYVIQTIAQVCKCIEEEFHVVERVDHGATLLQQEKFGYQSIHYIVQLKPQRVELPEYRKFKALKVEVQVRTILQHAWAEIEHDIGYKSPVVIPAEIRRRFAALGGMLEIADREFDGIQSQDLAVRAEAIAAVEQGDLGSVEITPYTLKAYLDKRLGPDARMTDFSYEYEAKRLYELGFIDLSQVEQCTSGYDDDRLSRIAVGSRQGQVSRFEYMLLAGIGEPLVQYFRRVWGEWALSYWGEKLKRLEEAGVQIRNYVPSGQPAQQA